MGQSGFAFFFFAVLVGCTYALAAWVRLHWDKIALAVRGDVPPARTLRYRSAQRRPIDIPYVAQRMLGDRGPLSGAVMVRHPAKIARPQRRLGTQLGFGF